jgi:hypothetical protein
MGHAIGVSIWVGGVLVVAGGAFAIIGWVILVAILLGWMRFAA